MTRLAIRLLGPFEVILDSEPVTRFETIKARALMAFLAAEAGSLHSREALAEMLWPDRAEGAARANLRHTLRSLRLAIGDYGTEPPFLLCSREAIALNPDGDCWVDSCAFAGSLAGLERGELPGPEVLEQAIGLYRGAFLEDLSLPDSAAFEEWRVLRREQFNRLVLEALHRLADSYERCGEYEQALAHARRRVELEPWDEVAHRQVMRLLALTGQRNAALTQYEACRTLLADELGVEPESETTQLYRRIRDGELESLAPARVRLPAFRLPRFLLEGAAEAPPPLFVARERELERLAAFADRAMQGTGCVAFVTGGPGQGKSALLAAFVRHAMAAHPDLLVARGDCNATSGAGDPYLPFRDVMAMLTGDLEARLAAGAMSRDHARRLWAALPPVMAALLAYGSSLIGTLLDGDALLSRLAVAAPDPDGRLDALRALAAQARSGANNLEQSFLFEQCTRVLRGVAEQHPLALVLDDLQWADNASIGLLFHLGRRLARVGNRVLIVCAYRPEELGPGTLGERHPLEKVLHELKRTFGDVWVDLDFADRKEGRRFVDAFLDAEPNHLGEAFRAALFHRTAGHPLFTIELLRAMQERGDLVREEADGAWMQGPELDWQALPARVEAAIEARVNHLEPGLREIASVASVEGEQFTAQVVAAVQGAAEKALLQDLKKLETVHRLVREQTEVQMGSRRAATYRFGHVLIQEYLYQRLSQGERRLLHGQVAAALESCCGEQLDEFAVQLAHHYHRAGDDAHALPYFTRAAENASRVYANDDAYTHYTRALETAAGVSADVGAVIGLYLGRGLVSQTLGNFEDALADYESALELAAGADDEGVEHLNWRTLLNLGRLWASRDYNCALGHLQRALELAQRMGDPAALARSLNWMGNWHLNAEDPQAAVAYHCEALKIFEQSGDRRGLATTLDLLGIASLLGADITASVGYYDRAIALFRELDDRPNLASSLTGRGHAGGTPYTTLSVASSTLPIDSRRDYEEALRITQEIGSPAGEAWVLWSLAILHIAQGRYGQALEAGRSGLDIASQISHREWIVGCRCILGILYVELFAPEEARRQLEPALTLAEELESRHWVHHATGTLAAAYCLLGDPAQAQTYLETVLSPETPMDTLNKRYCWARRAELALSQGDPAQALDVVERLIASAPGLSPGGVITFLWKLKGEALAAMGHPDEANSLLRAAIENARATGERFVLWRVHASLGWLYHTTDRQTEAEGAFSTARRLIQELADTLPGGVLRDNFLQRALGSLDAPPYRQHLAE
jgi:DNA-binding SARP family transcriptional activator